MPRKFSWQLADGSWWSLVANPGDATVSHQLPTINLVAAATGRGPPDGAVGIRALPRRMGGSRPVATGPKQERKRNMKKTLAEAVKGMQVKSWEVREHSDGKRVVYVRFAPKEPTLTVNVKEC